jgi:hypothetical protein
LNLVDENEVLEAVLKNHRLVKFCENEIMNIILSLSNGDKKKILWEKLLVALGKTSQNVFERFETVWHDGYDISIAEQIKLLLDLLYGKTEYQGIVLRALGSPLFSPQVKLIVFSDLVAKPIDLDFIKRAADMVTSALGQNFERKPLYTVSLEELVAASKQKSLGRIIMPVFEAVAKSSDIDNPTKVELLSSFLQDSFFTDQQKELVNLFENVLLKELSEEQNYKYFDRVLLKSRRFWNLFKNRLEAKDESAYDILFSYEEEESPALGLNDFILAHWEMIQNIILNEKRKNSSSLFFRLITEPRFTENLIPILSNIIFSEKQDDLKLYYIQGLLRNDRFMRWIMENLQRIIEAIVKEQAPYMSELENETFDLLVDVCIKNRLYDQIKIFLKSEKTTFRQAFSIIIKALSERGDNVLMPIEIEALRCKNLEYIYSLESFEEVVKQLRLMPEGIAAQFFTALLENESLMDRVKIELLSMAISMPALFAIIAPKGVDVIDKILSRAYFEEIRHILKAIPATSGGKAKAEKLLQELEVEE